MSAAVSSHTIRALAAAAIAAVAASCSSPEPLDNVVVTQNPETFNYVTQLQRGSASDAEIFEQSGYYIVFDDDARCANLTISNLVIEPSGSPLTLSFERVPIDYTSDRHNLQRIIRADALTSNDPVNAGTQITDVTFIHSQANDLDPYGYSGLFAAYTIYGRYRVVSFPYHIFMNGTTRIDNLTDSLTHIDYDPVYRLTLNPTRSTATLTIEHLSIPGDGAGELTVPSMQLSLHQNGFTATSARSLDVAFAGSRATLSDVEISAQELNQVKITFTLRNSGSTYSVAAFLTAYHTHK